jgi:hypothetical protein
LRLAEGLTWAAIRAQLHCSDSYIARWAGRFAAERLVGPHMTVARVWAKHSLKPHRLERYVASDYPDFQRVQPATITSPRRKGGSSGAKD